MGQHADGITQSLAFNKELADKEYSQKLSRTTFYDLDAASYYHQQFARVTAEDDVGAANIATHFIYQVGKVFQKNYQPNVNHFKAYNINQCEGDIREYAVIPGMRRVFAIAVARNQVNRADQVNQALEKEVDKFRFDP